LDDLTITLMKCELFEVANIAPFLYLYILRKAHIIEICYDTNIITTMCTRHSVDINYYCQLLQR